MNATQAMHIRSASAQVVIDVLSFIGLFPASRGSWLRRAKARHRSFANQRLPVFGRRNILFAFAPTDGIKGGVEHILCAPLVVVKLIIVARLKTIITSFLVKFLTQCGDLRVDGFVVA